MRQGKIPKYHVTDGTSDTIQKCILQLVIMVRSDCLNSRFCYVLLVREFNTTEVTHTLLYCQISIISFRPLAGIHLRTAADVSDIIEYRKID